MKNNSMTKTSMIISPTSNEVIYVTNPYTGSEGERQHRHRAVRTYTAHLIEQGLTAVSPIVHCHTLAAIHKLPTDFKFWQTYCLNLLAVCDKMHVLMLKGWEESIGVQAEIERAMEMEIDIMCADPKTYAHTTYIIPEYRTPEGD